MTDENGDRAERITIRTIGDGEQRVSYGSVIDPSTLDWVAVRFVEERTRMEDGIVGLVIETIYDGDPDQWQAVEIDVHEAPAHRRPPPMAEARQFPNVRVGLDASVSMRVGDGWEEIGTARMINRLVDWEPRW